MIWKYLWKFIIKLLNRMSTLNPHEKLNWLYLNLFFMKSTFTLKIFSDSIFRLGLQRHNRKIASEQTLGLKVYQWWPSKINHFLGTVICTKFRAKCHGSDFFRGYIYKKNFLYLQAWSYDVLALTRCHFQLTIPVLFEWSETLNSIWKIMTIAGYQLLA